MWFLCCALNTVKGSGITDGKNRWSNQNKASIYNFCNQFWYTHAKYYKQNSMWQWIKCDNENVSLPARDRILKKKIFDETGIIYSCKRHANCTWIVGAAGTGGGGAFSSSELRCEVLSSFRRFTLVSRTGAIFSSRLAWRALSNRSSEIVSAFWRRPRLFEGDPEVALNWNDLDLLVLPLVVELVIFWINWGSISPLISVVKWRRLLKSLEVNIISVYRTQFFQQELQTRFWITLQLHFWFINLSSTFNKNQRVISCSKNFFLLRTYKSQRVETTTWKWVHSPSHDDILLIVTKTRNHISQKYLINTVTLEN